MGDPGISGTAPFRARYRRSSFWYCQLHAGRLCHGHVAVSQEEEKEIALCQRAYRAKKAAHHNSDSGGSLFIPLSQTRLFLFLTHFFV